MANICTLSDSRHRSIDLGHFDLTLIAHVKEHHVDARTKVKASPTGQFASSTAWLSDQHNPLGLELAALRMQNVMTKDLDKVHFDSLGEL